MSRPRHGYTNATTRRGQGIVQKQYEGFEARGRSEREYRCLTHLADLLPLPDVVAQDVSGPILTLREVPGMHGQDVIEAGGAGEVLQLLGALLVRLQGIENTAVPGLAGVGTVIVHGDFGPQNVLIDNGQVSALLDWEFAHLGQPVEDLAWAEWIVRMHHPDHRDALPELFEAAQLDAAWADRQAAMVDRCIELVSQMESVGSRGALDLWRERLRVTESWSE